MTSKTITPCLGLSFNVKQIHRDIRWLLEEQLAFDIAKHCFDDVTVTKLGVNLTHPPMEGPALAMTQGVWPNDPVASKYLGPLTLGDKDAARAGLDASTFNITGAEIADLYIGTVIEEVKQYHRLSYPALNPVTRVYCAYLNTFTGYRMHTDQHTHFKYHLPIIENNYSCIFSENKLGLEMTHLPADGRLWRLDTRQLHSAVNMSPLSNNYRMHIIFTVYDDPFNIYESDVYAQP